MNTKGKPKKGNQSGNQTRGIRCFYRPSRPSAPWCVSWRVLGKKKTACFDSELARDTKADELREARKEGEVSRVMLPSEVREWRMFRELIGDAPLREVAKVWLERGAPLVSVSPTATAGATEYLADCEAKLARGELAADNLRHKRLVVKWYREHFEETPMSDITPAELEDWLDGLGGTGKTFNNRLKNLRAMYAWHELSVNPAKHVDPRKVVAGEAPVLSIEDTTKLLSALLERRILIRRLIFEIFAGVRTSSAERILQEDVRLDQRGLLLPADRIKTQRRHFIDKLPEVLWQWYDVGTDDCWSLNPKAYMHEKSRLFVAAGVKNPGNVLRHTFATYHLAAYGDPSRTSAILCHVNPAMLWRTYKGNATQEHGVRYLALSPELVARHRARSQGGPESRQGRATGGQSRGAPCDGASAAR